MLFGKDPSRPLHPLIEVTPGKDTVALKYEGGAGAVLTVHPDGTVEIVFSDVPSDVRNYGCVTFLSIRFIDGGKWRMNDSKEKPFPTEKSTPPQFSHGHPETFSIFGGDGHGLTFTMTRTPYVELTDNREWGQNIFVWRFFSPFDPGRLSDRIRIVPTELSAGGGAPVP